MSWDLSTYVAILCKTQGSLLTFPVLVFITENTLVELLTRLWKKIET